MLDAPFYGMSPIEVIWNAENHKWLPDKIVGKPPEWFMFDPENNLRFKSLTDMIEGEEIPEYKFLLPRHHASYQNPYGERVLSRCFWPVTFKKGGFKFWSIFTEKFGMPWIIGKVPRSTNDTERSSLLTNLTSMVQDAVAVINDDESVDITEASGKKASADIYDKLIEAANKEVSKAILGQTATTEGTPGKLGDEHAQIETKEDIVDSDKQMVCSAWNLLFRWITELNSAGANPPEFVFYEEEDIRKTRSERDTELSNQGVRFTKFYYQRAYNLQEKDFEIQASPPASPGKPAALKFVEGDADIHASADALTKKTLADASMDDLIEPAKKLLNQVNSLEEFRDGLFELSENMDESSMGDFIERALILAELSGRFDAFDR
jgi:phage gp29-like protein